MKYCKNCREVYGDSVTECKNSIRGFIKHTLETIHTETEAKCYKCGSDKNLKYTPKRKSSYGTEFEDYFTCEDCIEKMHKEIIRQEAMSYVIYDKDCGEFNYCKNKSEAQDWFREMANGYDSTITGEDYLIFKVERVEDISKENLPNKLITNLLVYEEEFYKIEEIYSPYIEYNGEIDVNL